MKICRLIRGENPPATAMHGAMQMALDESLLRSAAEGGIATLRFYRWSPATLSIGYFQQLDERASHGTSQGCPVVRRASGGGAIVHDREWTYSLAMPTTSRFGDTEHYYLAFHETLIEVLRAQDVEARLHVDRERATEKSPFLCFQRRSSGDIMIGRHKVVGSAQRRWQQALLQHGSVLLEASSFAPELPGLRDLTGRELDADELLQQWLEKLSHRLKTEFDDDSLTDKEWLVADQLRQTKFGRQAWTERR